MKRISKWVTATTKAQGTAQWARTMTKWLITYGHSKGARWQVVNFLGKAGGESRGVVDLMAIRKDHRQAGSALMRGDRFEIVLIQTKGGTAPPPTASDCRRLAAVAQHHRARAVVLAVWRKGKAPTLHLLKGGRWHPAPPSDVFG